MHVGGRRIGSIPILRVLAPHRREITAFLGDAAATQATGIVGTGRFHLRATNSLHAELLAAHPRRIGSNRSNPYPTGRPRAVSLGQVTVDTMAEVLPPDEAGTRTPAPPCNQPGPATFQGRRLRYPHVERER